MQPQNMKWATFYRTTVARPGFPAVFALTQTRAALDHSAKKKLVIGFFQVGAENGRRTANAESIKG
jgi:hypothetical protein